MSEAFVIRNYGKSRIIPTYKGNYTLNSDFTFHSQDEKLVKELSSMPFVDAKSLGDINLMTIQKLRKLAVSCGVKGTFLMKKVELIKILGGN